MIHNKEKITSPWSIPTFISYGVVIEEDVMIALVRRVKKLKIRSINIEGIFKHNIHLRRR